jgi:hypothetical protein
MDQITAIRTSLSAFVCGIVGLVPLLGLVGAVHALNCHRSVRARYGNQWNPAAPYLRAGYVFGLIGLASSFLLIGMVAVALLE